MPEPLRICLDARMARWDGIGTYTVEVLAALSRVAEQEDLKLSAVRSPADRFLEERPGSEAISWSSVGGSVWSPASNLKVGRLAQGAADVFHSPHVVLPLGFAGPIVATIHDLIPLLPLEREDAGAGGPTSCGPTGLVRSWLKRNIFALYLRHALRRADAVLLDSRHAAAQLVSRVGNPQRLHLEPLGVASRFSRLDAETIEEVLGRYGKGILRPHDYVLWVGGFRPHKNLNVLIQAFAALPADQRRETRLVLAGRASNEYAEWLRRQAEEAGVGEEVVFPGYIPDDDLPALYSGAAVFVFPSLYEGFGLPPLEAAACGVPVLCADRPPLTEVMGSAAGYFDPLEVGALAHLLSEVLGSPGRRQELGRRAHTRSRQFSWDAVALDLAKVYRLLWQERPARQKRRVGP